MDEADEKEEVEDANAQKRRRLLPFKLPGERRPLLGDGGIPYPVLEEEEEVEMGEDELDEDAVDDKDAMDDRDDDATTSKYFGKDRSSTSPRKQPRDFDSPASPRQIGSPPADDESPTVNPDNTPAPDVVSPPPVADRSSSPLEVASPPPAADASSPLRPYSPPAAADHIAFDNDGYEEGSGDELGGAEAEDQETRVRRTGDVPEEETMVVSEDIVLGSSDVEGEREGEAFQDGRRRDSSEPLAYESTEDGEVEVRLSVLLSFLLVKLTDVLRLLSRSRSLLLRASRTSSPLELGILRRRFSLEMLLHETLHPHRRRTSHWAYVVLCCLWAFKLTDLGSRIPYRLVPHRRTINSPRTRASLYSSRSPSRRASLPLLTT